ncbi:MAG: hypothetical protein ACYDBQ_05205 [Thermoplasmatota archaeon]
MRAVTGWLVALVVVLSGCSAVPSAAPGRPHAAGVGTPAGTGAGGASFPTPTSPYCPRGGERPAIVWSPRPGFGGAGDWHVFASNQSLQDALRLTSPSVPARDVISGANGAYGFWQEPAENLAGNGSKMPSEEKQIYDNLTARFPAREMDVYTWGNITSYAGATPDECGLRQVVVDFAPTAAEEDQVAPFGTIEGSPTFEPVSMKVTSKANVSALLDVPHVYRLEFAGSTGPA